MPLQRLLPALLLVTSCISAQARAAGGPLGIDHEWALDQQGIWARSYQIDLEYGVIAAGIGGALWYGNDDPAGHVFWQTLDSMAASAVAATGLKYAFSRARPNQGNNPDLWFQGHGDESFPSGEVTLQASFVTPFIVNYGKAHPWIWALELLPIYDGMARLKSQAHWQTDVLAGWALGSGMGLWAANREVPLTVRWLPGGISVGLQKHY